MNKKIIKLFFIAISLFIIVKEVSAENNNKYKNPRTNYKVIIEDDAKLLTEEEILTLTEEVKSLTEYGNIAFKTITQNSTSTSNYASNYYHKIFGTSSGTLFLIDMDNRYIYIFSDGSNYKTITKAKANIITDNVYKYATKREYYICASKAFEQINTLLDGGKILEPMRYISNILISFVTAFLLSFIIVLFTTKIKRATNKEILSKCNITFNIGNISTIKTGQHKVYSPVSDSSSFGGSGGSSSGGGGGGSSGGGGGHSF